MADRPPVRDDNFAQVCLSLLRVREIRAAGFSASLNCDFWLPIAGESVPFEPIAVCFKFVDTNRDQ